MEPSVSIVMPAWNEAQTIGITLKTLRIAKQADAWWDELIVVDDGSNDETFSEASRWADKVVRHTMNKGKGAALQTGCAHASYSIVLFLDADLGESAIYANKLLLPILNQEADMVIANFTPNEVKAGFGLVKRLAKHGIYRLSGYEAVSPLSGQRAIRKHIVDRLTGMSDRFGIEVGLTIDIARLGYAICEVDVPFRHRETGRDLSGFIHRGKQFVAVSKTLVHKWLHPTC